MIYLQLLFLIVVANGTPLVGRVILGDRLACPLDFGCKFLDGRPLFGPSKTLRGVLLSVASTIVCALPLGLSVGTGLTISLSAMLGDSLSSFTKRRMGKVPGSRLIGLDHIPESLLPLLVVQQKYDLALGAMAGTVLAFTVIDVVLSTLLEKAFRLRHSS